MVPRLGQKYEFEAEVISKPIADYQTDEYFQLDLPTAPRAADNRSGSFFLISSYHYLKMT